MDVLAHETKNRPIVAVLTVDDDERSFRGNRNNFIDLIRTGSEMGVLVYVVTVKNLKLSQRKVLGYIYDADTKSWSSQLLPLPHVLYNRIPYRKDEMQPEVQHALQSCIKSKQIRLFNPAFFNKWALFEWLGRSRLTKKYIPMTRKLSSSQELRSMLQIHNTLYLKPDRGKAGKGIMKVKRVPPRNHNKVEYWLTIQESKNSTTLKYPNVAEVWNNIRHYVVEQEYIAQQAIPLLSYKKRPFDLRVLVQKNAKGLWTFTGVGARVAGKESITTHVPRGGSIDDPEKLLTSVLGKEAAKKVIIRVKKAALTIAKQVEKKSGHMLGEMSMDLGIDTAGSIWFFEANSKPMKFDEPHIRKKSLERVIQYSLYLKKRLKPRIFDI